MDSKKKCTNCSRTVGNEANFCPSCGSKVERTSECPVCLDTKRLETTPCGHNICEDCIPRLKETNKCHMCRASLRGWNDPESNSSSSTFDTNSSLYNYVYGSSVRSSNSSSYSSSSRSGNGFNYSSGYGSSVMFSSSGYSSRPVTERFLYLCPKCNSRDHTHSQREGNYCNNCRQYFGSCRRIKESNISDFPVQNKEDVNPTIKYVCPACNGDDIERFGPQWDMQQNCKNPMCRKKNILQLKTITLREWEHVRPVF